MKRTVKKWIDWADVIHYTWAPLYNDARDVKYAFDKGKKIFVEWVGSDIRNPDYLKTINPYYKLAFENGYEYSNLTLSEIKKIADIKHKEYINTNIEKIKKSYPFVDFNKIL